MHCDKCGRRVISAPTDQNDPMALVRQRKCARTSANETRCNGYEHRQKDLCARLQRNGGASTPAG